MRFAFAVVAGANLAELQANADAAYDKYWEIFTGIEEFGARALAGAVELSWEPTTIYAGFNIYRAEADASASPTKVNRHLITGQKPFRYLDSSVVAGAVYNYTLEAVTLGGAKDRFGPVGVKAQGKAKAASFSLSQNYPNPARGTTTITFALAQASEVKLEVFDVSGRKVATLAEGPRAAGDNEASLDTRNLAAGVYVYRLQAGDKVAVKRLAVVK
ncbi:MAG: T9SS type A sorting domain-containing protein [candidate division Zixibacteria bacterium]|nr:T9SS type A sorting domain-containing protein [candidate division Zixibacteria bacterium]